MNNKKFKYQDSVIKTKNSLACWKRLIDREKDYVVYYETNYFHKKIKFYI